MQMQPKGYVVNRDDVVSSWDTNSDHHENFLASLRDETHQQTTRLTKRDLKLLQKVCCDNQRWGYRQTIDNTAEEPSDKSCSQISITVKSRHTSV